VNAGAIPVDHWTQNPEIGGGRVLGEACHVIDLLRCLADASVESFDVAGLVRANGPPRTDVASITLKFEDGSFGVIHYLANGHKALPKERLEVFCAGRVLVLDNFRKLTGYGWAGFNGKRLWRQDKGHSACVAAFVRAVRAGTATPIPIEQILEVSRISIQASEKAG
jgi:predicted dehydrogenase